MFDIQWRSGFGYGDFVTGLGYAHNASVKYQTKVNLVLHWDHELDFKETAEDPETIIERMWYIYDTMVQSPNVNIDVRVNSKPSYRFINNLDEFNPVHGLWNTSLPLSYTNAVVLWRSKYNTYFPGIQKDPAHDKWDDVIDWLISLGYDVHEVTYRTPVSEVIDKISKCAFGLGYDGMVHQLFKYMWKPLIVICERHKLNNLLIPQASLEKDVGGLVKRGLDFYINQSYNNINKFKRQHQKYLNETINPFTHPLYNTQC
jgi:hypothetical protein